MQQRKNIPVKEGDDTMLTGDLLRVRIKDMTLAHKEQVEKVQMFFDSEKASNKAVQKKVKKKKLPSKTIEPIFISTTSQKQLQRSQTLLDIFSRALEFKVSRQEVENSIQEIAQMEVDHKVLHGFAKVLFNRCRFLSPGFELQEIISPSDVRHMTFSLAAKKRREKGISSQNSLVRNTILEEVVGEIQKWFEQKEDQKYQERSVETSQEETSQEETSQEELQRAIITNLKAKDIESYLYADLKENHVLCEMDKNMPKNPVGLISRYNLSLCQSLLLRATEMDVYIDFSSLHDGSQQDSTLQTSKWLRFLFRHIKFQQLMYRIWQVQPQSNPELYHIRIDGPQSIFQKSSRYGMKLALFLPALVLFPGKWYATATVLWGKKRKMKRLFCLSNKSNLVSHYQATGLWRSSSEENFELRFQVWLEKESKKGLEVQWSLEAGRLFCLEDGRLCISDFVLKHPLGDVNVEILGYWKKKEALHQKRRPKKEHYILVVSKNLISDKVLLKGKEEEQSLLQKDVVVFRDIIPIKKIMERARSLLKIH
jgi:uncharacterized protein